MNGSEKRIRKFGSTGEIRLRARESGKINVSVLGHAALELVPCETRFETRGTYGGFETWVTPEELVETIAIANEMADKAIAKEAAAVGAVATIPEV